MILQIWRGKNVSFFIQCTLLCAIIPHRTVFIQGRDLLGSCILGFDGTPPYTVQLLITFGVLDENENCRPQLLY